mgnify:FL=1|jgi:hypothetical protein
MGSFRCFALDTMGLILYLLGTEVSWYIRGCLDTLGTVGLRISTNFLE